MADYEGRINIAVTSDGVDKAKKSLSDLTKAGAGAERSTEKLAGSTKKTADEIVRASYESGKLIDKTEKLATASNRAADSVASYAKNFAAGFIGAQTIGSMIRVSDEYVKLTGQLKIATTSQADFNAAFSDVQRIANRAQADLGTISTLYSRLSLSLREIGVSSNQVAAITETVSLALKASGAGAGETASTMLQLSQAFGSGVLRGEEFNAVMEASPNLMRALAQSMGVPIGQLRSLAEEGQLTSDILVKAFADPKILDAFRKQAAEVNTISGAFTSLANELKLSFNSFEDSVGLFKRLAKEITDVGKGIKYVRELLQGNPLEDAKKELGTKQKQLTAIDKADPLTQLIMGGPQFREQLISDIKRLTSEVEKLENPKPSAGKTAGGKSVAAQLKEQLDDFTKKNPLKDIQAATDKYNASVKLLNDNLKAGNITKEEAARYEKQLKDELDRATASQDKKNKAVKSGADDQKKAIDSLIESARRIAPINEDDIAQLQRKLDTTKNLTLSQKSLVQSEIEAAKVRQEAANDDAYINRMQDYAIAVQDTIDSLKESIQRQQDENLVRAGLADSVESLVIARKEEKLEMLRGLGASDETIAALQKEINLRKQLAEEAQKGRNIDAQKKAEQERVRETEKANEQIKRDYERTYESIQRSLTDALLRGFESGKSFAENFRNTLINMFKTLVLTPAINFILSPITDAVANGVAGTANQGITSTAGSIFKNLSSVFTSTNQSIIGGIESIGATIANGMGGIRDTIGGFIGANASTLANITSYAGAVLQLSQGNLAGAALTAVGTYFGGPIGGAIGSAIGGLFGKKKSTPRYSSGVTGSFFDGTFTSTSTSGISGFKGNAGGQEGLTAAASVFSTSLDKLLRSYGIKAQIDTSLQFYKRKGAWGAAQISVGGVQTSITGGDSVYSKDAQTAFNNLINQFLTQGFSNAVKASTLPEGLKNLFDGITDTTQMNNMLSAVIKLSTAQDELASRFGLTASQAGFVAQQSGLAGDELTAFVNSLSDAGLASATVGEQMVKFRNSLTDVVGGTLFDNLDAFDAALKGIDKTTEEGIARFYELFSIRDEFATFTNSVDTLKGNVKSALLGIVSDSEQQSILQADLADMFDSLNLAMPATIDELIALGKSIDYTSAAGLTLAASFPALVQAFTQTQQVIADLTKTTDDFATQFEYLRYQALAKNYGTSFANNFVPSFAVGTNYVPADGLAMIHQGERIIPAADNQTLMQNSADMVQAIRDLRSDVNNLNAAMQSAAINTAKSAKSLDNIERGGVIISDIGIDGNEQILKVEVVA